MTDPGRILLTGASGFVGRQILKNLTETGRPVFALARHSRSGYGREVQWLNVDLHSVEDVGRCLTEIRPSLCIHAAWSVTSRDFWTTSDNLRWVSSSLALAEAFVRSGGQRFVGVGTQAEYVDGSEICSEATTATLGSTLYGIAKDSTRRLIEQFCKSSDVQFAWARIFNVFGAGEQPYKLIPSVTQGLMAEGRAKISSGSATRDYIDVRDVGRAIAAVGLSSAQGAVNIGTGRGTTVIDVALRLAKLMNKPDGIDIGALADRPGETNILIADVTRLRNEIGFSPDLSLEDGLKDAIAYWTQKEPVVSSAT